MKNLLSLVLFQEVFENRAIPALPFLCILLVFSPIFVTYGVVKLIKNQRVMSPEEIADRELLSQVRKGKVDPTSYSVKLAEQRVYTNYCLLQDVDNS